MLSKQKIKNQTNLYFSLRDTLNKKHPLFILAEKIDWNRFEKAFSQLYSQNNGRPAKPIRLMVGLLILKHLRNISDESVVEQWSENIYYQYFCGQVDFLPGFPCEASELVHFRHRIGEKGIELIFQESIRINGKDSLEAHVSVDTTVQEKNITFPTDTKNHKKIIEKCKQIAAKENIQLRQSYGRILKKLLPDLRFRNHPRNKKKALQSEKKIKTIAWRLTNELERKLAGNIIYEPILEIFKKIFSQKKDSKNKIYSVHEPETECISKGKTHKKYEFGNKVSIVKTQNTGVIVGAKSFRNEYDGHTLEDALKQAVELLGKAPKTATVDRGYQGKSFVDEIQILIPKPFKVKNMSKNEQKKIKQSFKRRASIEPIIGHLKFDHRLSRNFYKGLFGDGINVLLAAAAFNFKRMMRKWKASIFNFFPEITNYFFTKLQNLFFLKFLKLNF